MLDIFLSDWNYADLAAVRLPSHFPNFQTTWTFTMQNHVFENLVDRMMSRFVWLRDSPIPLRINVQPDKSYDTLDKTKVQLSLRSFLSSRSQWMGWSNTPYIYQDTQLGKSVFQVVKYILRKISVEDTIIYTAYMNNWYMQISFGLWRHNIFSAMVQVTACLFCAKPLSPTKMSCWQSNLHDE